MATKGTVNAPRPRLNVSEVTELATTYRLTIGRMQKAKPGRRMFRQAANITIGLRDLKSPSKPGENPSSAYQRERTCSGK